MRSDLDVPPQLLARADEITEQRPICVHRLLHLLTSGPGTQRR